MNVLIIDGQGGGVGRLLVERIAEQFQDANIIACGTNSMATANMLKGAKISGATGENAVIYNAKRADIIVGPVGIVMVNAMLGEITPRMAEAVTDSDAKIFLIPMNRCQTKIVGVQEKKISEYVDEVIEMMQSGK